MTKDLTGRHNLFPFSTARLLRLLISAFVLSPVFVKAASKDLCRQSLQTPSKNTPHVDSDFRPNPQLRRLFETSIAFSDDLIHFKNSNPRKQFDLAVERLKAQGIEYAIVTPDNFFSRLIRRPKLTIIPAEKGHTLNQMAFKLKRQMDVTLVYEPHELVDGLLAYYTDGIKEIALPHTTVFTGIPDLSVYHEIRHAAMDNKTAKGKPTPYEGSYHNSKKQGKKAGSYASYLSFQEIATYSQDAKYAYRAIYDPSMSLLSESQFRELANEAALEIHRAKNMIKKSRQLLLNAIAMLDNKQGRIYLTEHNDQFIEFEIVVDRHIQYYFTIPLVEPFNNTSSTVENLLRQHILKIDALAEQKLEDVEAYYMDLLEDGLVKN